MDAKPADMLDMKLDTYDIVPAENDLLNIN